MNKRGSLIFSLFVTITLFFTALGSAQVNDGTIFLKKHAERTDVDKLQKDTSVTSAPSANSTDNNGDNATVSTKAEETLSKTEEAVSKTEAQVTKAAVPTAKAETPAVRTKTTTVKTKAPAEKVKVPAASTKITAEKRKITAKPKVALVSRAKTDIKYLIPWYGQAEKIFARGDTAKVYDIKSGLSFNIKRTYGYNHADCETLTKADTEIMKKIYGGQLSWARRPVIVIVDGRKIAASMAGMPHAGVDSEPANVYVTGRSQGYGSGDNLDTIKGNDMDGHFDIHFLGSRTHGTNSVNAAHQDAVKEAAAWAEKNY